MVIVIASALMMTLLSLNVRAAPAGHHVLAPRAAARREYLYPNAYAINQETSSKLVDLEILINQSQSDRLVGLSRDGTRSQNRNQQAHFEVQHLVNVSSSHCSKLQP